VDEKSRRSCWVLYEKGGSIKAARDTYAIERDG
jgi:hypothetical protein